jgi:sec-independent protein translocase protein TatA
MPQLGPAEILVVLIVALMVFGPKRLPEVGRQVGRGLKELRKIQETVRDEINDVLHAPEPTSTPSGVPPLVVTPPPVGAIAARPAPSRFRPAIGAAPLPSESAPPPVAPSATNTAPTSKMAPTSPGTHAPSRFRAPGA